MITARTKRQLVIFVILTLVGVSFVGARYAKLTRLFYSSTYNVNAHFPYSGGAFVGSEVDYRGVEVGQVTKMVLINRGVDVVLSINKSDKKIPANTIARVGNRSAVGEQYVDLEPRTNSGPYLANGSVIAPSNTRIPVQTVTLLTNLQKLIGSVPKGDLRTSVSELGAAFKGTGPSLASIIDGSDSFIQAANANFGTTTALLHDSQTVLQTQVDKTSAIKTFSRDLQLLTGTLAGHDKDLRSLIDNGSATTNELRSFLNQNRVQLGQLINNLVTTGQVTVAHLKGIRQILVIYPYMVVGGFTVAAKGPNGYDAHFGLILQQSPSVCTQGYGSTNQRSPYQRADEPMNTAAHCSESAATSNARGAQNAPHDRPGADYRPAPGNSGPPVATYHLSTKSLNWAAASSADAAPSKGHVVYTGGAASLYGQAGSWQSLLLNPAAGSE